MLASTSEGVCFLINAISYIFVVVSLLLMKLKNKDTIARETNVLKQLREGLDYTFGFAPIKHLILLLSVANLMGMFYSVLMPVYAEKILHGGSNTFGFLMSAAGFGALIGALYLASRETILKLGRLIPASAFLFGAGLVALAFTNILFISLILMVFIGVGMMLHTAASNTILQTLTDDDKRGRVMSFYAMSIMGTAPFSSLIAGVLAKAIGTPATISIGGFVTMIGALIFYKKLPGLKLVVRPIYIKMGLESEVAIGLQKASEPSVKNAENES
jgi:MFS family permease